MKRKLPIVLIVLAAAASAAVYYSKNRRAKDLAEEVLQRYPRGAQCEEAMAVAMEAASLDGDELTARRWAERYLESFGAGRFADRARDVLAASPR